MSLLVIVEGQYPDKDLPSLIKKRNIGKIRLLYLSPRVKASLYKEKLHRALNPSPEIEIIRHKELVDFYYLRETLIDFIAILPEHLKVRGRGLCEFLTVDGLNMWWTSGIVEATPYKRRLFQNLYHLSAVKKVLEKFDIDLVYTQIKDEALRKDLMTLNKAMGIEIYEARRKRYLAAIICCLRDCRKFAVGIYSFILHILFSVLFRVICPERIKPSGKDTHGRKLHIFYTSYPGEVSFNINGAPEAKIYKDFPDRLSKKMGGNHYYLCHLFTRSISSMPRLVRDAREMWMNDFRFIPINTFVPIGDMLKILFSSERYRKYRELKNRPEYRDIFKIDNIDMFNTFDRVMEDSLTGYEAMISLLHYYAFRNFTRLHAKDISEIAYYLEFHSWEAALISGVKSADSSVLVIGLQQSAPNPTLLNFFFSPLMFKDKTSGYPLPDMILCSGQIYKDLFISNGIEPERLKIVGHISGRCLDPERLSDISRSEKRARLKLPSEGKICLIACSIDTHITEAIVFMIGQVAPRLPEMLFLLKEHPNSPAKPFMVKYAVYKQRNVKTIDHPIGSLLSLADYFLSSSTSTSQEALYFGIPQANLDVAGLPNSNPIHFVPGLIKDIETTGELLDFFANAEKYIIPKEKASLFMGDLEKDPYQEILNILGNKERMS